MYNYISKIKFSTECNHNPNDTQRSLILLAKQTMAYPPEFDFFCPICKETFTFKRNKEGIYYSDDDFVNANEEKVIDEAVTEEISKLEKIIEAEDN